MAADCVKELCGVDVDQYAKAKIKHMGALGLTAESEEENLAKCTECVIDLPDHEGTVACLLNFVPAGKWGGYHLHQAAHNDIAHHAILRVIINEDKK